jgi:hypothetical protein
MRLMKLAVAAMSLFASGTLLAQSAPPKQTPQQPVKVAAAPGPAESIPGGRSAGSDAATATAFDGVNAFGAVAIVLGVAAIAAAANDSNSNSTTHH